MRGRGKQAQSRRSLHRSHAPQRPQGESLPWQKNAGRTPSFKTEAEERAFGEGHDSRGRVDWHKASRVRFPNLKPSTRVISTRLPVDLLERLRIAASKRNVPCQSLIKVWLSEKVDAA